MPGPMPTLLDYFPPLDPYLNVLYQDGDILVLDKQSGLLTVPGKDPSLWDCVEYRARQTWPTAGIVHRLDKDTSGVLVMALNKRAHGRIGSQFEHRKTTKSYVARVAGLIEADSGLVDLPLATDWDNKPRQRVDYEHGRAAQTEWAVMEREADVTRVRLHPLTGRTHQLRVHMKAIGHVILGDAFYGDSATFAAAPRLQLHAAELGFTHPTSGEFMVFTAPTPF
ncbi:RNA pseudouridine synthase [Devosia yakushimensis]|uniref:Pseudouridine synthase n=1 Tax=Devosia yakushimensis TaxID=470028 RepID=A0ABQ5UAE9_9HYPH|nr:RluA family pseudouridine synthase [Devosia yakushimensis]GLQ09094.1 RNA pseudouridine synthase [Devosia yakushimensis]